MAPKVVDFNAFRAERDLEPIIFKIGDDEYLLAPSLPASIAVDVIALQTVMEEKADVPLDILNSVGVACFGADEFSEVLNKHRVGLDELPKLVEQVLLAYTPEVDDEDPADPPTAST